MPHVMTNSELPQTSNDTTRATMFILEGVVAQWCNPKILKSEQSGGVGSSAGRAHHLTVMTRGRGLD